MRAVRICTTVDLPHSFLVIFYPTGHIDFFRLYGLSTTGDSTEAKTSNNVTLLTFSQNSFPDFVLTLTFSPAGDISRTVTSASDCPSGLTKQRFPTASFQLIG